MVYRLITLILFFTIACTAQNNSKDSLITLLENQIEKGDFSLLYSDLSRQLIDIDLDLAFAYSKRGFDISERRNNYLGVAVNARNIGLIKVKKNELDSAKIYYEFAFQNFDIEGKLFESTQSKMRIGNIHLAQNNHIEAINIYQKCLSISKENNFKLLLPHLYNNLGLLYLEIEDYNDARNNFVLANKLFLENDDEVSANLSQYNISLIQSNLGDYDKAIEGYLNVASYHLKSENWMSLAFCYNSISRIYRTKKDLDKSEEFLLRAINSLKGKSDSFNSGPSSLFEVSIYTNAAELYLQKGSLNKAKKYASDGLGLAKLNSYKENIYRNAKVLGIVYDNYEKTDSALYYYKLYMQNFDQYRNENDVKKVTKLKMQSEFDEILNKIKIDSIYQEASYKQRELKYIGIAVFALLAGIILILLYLNQKNKTGKLTLMKEKLELEKRELNLDLDYKKKELASSMMFLMEKNEFITSLSNKLIGLKPEAKKNNKELIQQIVNEIKQNSSQSVWDDFEIRFKEVHADFYKKLNHSFPDLTPNEIKICAFLRLNMTTKEISAITHQSIKSINMARFRLRKKIKIDRDQNLIKFLNDL